MGQQIFKSEEYKQACTTLSNEELLLIKQQFAHLSSRSSPDHPDTVDKDTFLKFIPLPGMLGERLFTVCDRDHDNAIDFEDFVCSMAVLAHGSKEDRYKLMFQMYDLTGSGHIAMYELEMMMNSIRDSHTPPPSAEEHVDFATLNEVQAQALAAKIEEEIHDIDLKLADSHGGSATFPALIEQKYQKERILAKMGRSVLEDYRLKGETLHQTMKKVAGEALRTCDPNHTGTLTYQQFRQWADQNPVFFDSIFETAGIHELRHRIETRPSLRNIDISKPESLKGVKFGYLYKGHLHHKHLHRRFYLLQDHFLYEFKNEKAALSNETMPRKAIFLPGCHIYSELYFRPTTPGGDSDFHHTSPTFGHSRLSRSTSRPNLREMDRARSKSRERPYPNARSTSVEGFNEFPSHEPNDFTVTLPRSHTSDDPRGRSSVRERAPPTQTSPDYHSESVSPQPIKPDFRRVSSTSSLKGLHAAALQKERDRLNSSPDAVPHTGLRSHHEAEQYPKKTSLVRTLTQPGFDKDDHPHRSGFHASISNLFSSRKDHQDAVDEITSITKGKKVFSASMDMHPSLMARDDDDVEFIALSSDDLHHPHHEESHHIPDRRQLHEIEIICPNHDYFLFAEDAESFHSWVHALQDASEDKHVEDYYEISWQEQLGTGYFADVYVCRALGDDRHEVGERFACKIVYKNDMSEAQTEMFRAEISCLNLVRHPNIVSVYNIFDTPEKMYIVMELLEGGSVLSRLEKNGFFTNEQGRDIVRQTLQGIAYLHDVGIVHRDLKPGNLVFSSFKPDAVLKIVDFGLSILAAPTDPLEKPVGTLKYFAPELILHKTYNRAVDMWCLGVVSYIIMTSQFPFEARSQTDLLSNIANARFNTTSDAWMEMPEEPKDFIKRLLVVDPYSRLTAAECLHHPWITGEKLTPSYAPRAARSPPPLDISPYYRSNTTSPSPSPSLMYSPTPSPFSSSSNLASSRTPSADVQHNSSVSPAPRDSIGTPTSPSLSPSVRKTPPPFKLSKSTSKST